jgi:formyl-CoA transferase
VEGPVRLLGPPLKLSRTPAQPTRAPGPTLGEHTEEILAGAGFSAEAITGLLATGAVAGPGAAQGSFLSG